MENKKRRVEERKRTGNKNKEKGGEGGKEKMW
jgi:hypothetical protein